MTLCSPRVALLLVVLGCSREPPDSSAIVDSAPSAAAESSSQAPGASSPTSSADATGNAGAASSAPLELDVHGKALLEIAREIDALGAKVPAFRDFDMERNFDPKWLRIHYAYKAEFATVQVGRKHERRPVPETDGIWLFINFHEGVEESERHSQVFRGDDRHLDRRVLVTIYTGKDTRHLGEAVWRILAKHDTVSLGLEQAKERALRDRAAGRKAAQH